MFSSKLMSLPCVSAPQRDQMYAAQEMFKTANKVTRPEKALILGFMAGSRGTALIIQSGATEMKRLNSAVILV